MKVLQWFGWRGVYPRSPSNLFQHTVRAKYFRQFDNVAYFFPTITITRVVGVYNLGGLYTPERGAMLTLQFIVVT